jgi:hypothetical protein
MSSGISTPGKRFEVELLNIAVLPSKARRGMLWGRPISCPNYLLESLICLAYPTWQIRNFWVVPQETCLLDSGGFNSWPGSIMAIEQNSRSLCVRQ